MTKRNWKTAAELMAELRRDPAFVARERQQEEELRRKETEAALAEAPIVAELRSAGVPVESVWDLVNARNTHVESLPILLHHLQRPYPNGIREGLARALAVPEAKFAWPVLVDLFQRETDRQAKDGLAVAISNIADEETLDELIALARDRRHGESRILLLDALRRWRLPKAKKALMDLGGDPDLHKEVQRILRKRRRKD